MLSPESAECDQFSLMLFTSFLTQQQLLRSSLLFVVNSYSKTSKAISTEGTFYVFLLFTWVCTCSFAALAVYTLALKKYGIVIAHLLQRSFTLPIKRIFLLYMRPSESTERNGSCNILMTAQMPWNEENRQMSNYYIQLCDAEIDTNVWLGKWKALTMRVPNVKLNSTSALL